MKKDVKTEFKVNIPDTIAKEIIAFANSDGGTIYIGVNDEGEPVGLDDFDAAYTRLTNIIRDAILPDITLFVGYTHMDGNILRIDVSEGSGKPYYLKSKGLCPGGVYVRQGTSSVHASPDRIRSMIKHADGDVFEDMLSAEQSLTFNEAAAAFERYRTEFGPDRYLSLGLTTPGTHAYTNLGRLLSDQCAHTVKAAVFDDTDNLKFQDRAEFRGSIFRQMNEAFRYLQLCNRTPSTIRGLVRIDSPEYPEEAIREALINALIHRDYSLASSTMISVNRECMEFLSVGGVLPAYAVEDLCAGVSAPRNRKLAAVFYRLHLIEAYGTGLRRIFRLYRDCPVQPTIQVTPNTFKLTLPNRNTAVPETRDEAPVCIVSEPSPAPTEGSLALSAQDESILGFVRERNTVTAKDIQEYIGLKKTRTSLLLRDLCDRGLLVAKGKGPARHYCTPSSR